MRSAVEVWSKAKRWDVFVKIILYVGFSFLILASQTHRALAEVELPSEELARESVVPKFENPVSVKNRNIVLTGKFEVGPYFGLNFSEPIENQTKFGVNLGYHLNEDHAIVLNYAQWISGLNTQYTSGLSSASSRAIDFTRAPALQNSAWFHWEPTLFYGKISITKLTVLNLHFYPIVGLGETTYSNKMYYGADVGGGFHFYFNKTWALRSDLKVQYSGKPNPFLTGFMKVGDPVPSPAQFGDEYVLSTIFDLGVIALF